MFKPIQDCRTLGELLANPQRWTKKAHARDLFGNTIPVHSPNSVCFCLSGALRFMDLYYYNQDDSYYWLTKRWEIEKAIKTMFPNRVNYNSLPTIPAFNDHPDTVHEDVVKVINSLGL